MMKVGHTSIVNAAKISMSGNDSFANKSTLTISFLIVPLFQSGFFILLAASSQNSSLLLISYKASLLTSSICTIEAINSSFAYERRSGVASYLVALGKINIALVIGKLIPVVVLSSSILFVEIGIMLSVDHKISLALICVYLLLGWFSVVLSMAIGFCIGILSLTIRDPFVFSNLYTFFLITFSGIFGQQWSSIELFSLISSLNPFAYVIAIFQEYYSSSLSIYIVLRNISCALTIVLLIMFSTFFVFRLTSSRLKKGFDFAH
jgi:hypothetical protein